MNESQISVRYAKALFLSASENNHLDRVYSDMELLTDTCKIEEFQYMLVIPSLQASQKNQIISEVLGEKVCELSSSLIGLVVKNRRERYLPGIARNFMDLYRKEKGIRTASLVTASPVSKDVEEQIRSLIAKAFGNVEVDLHSSVNQDVIGGFVLRIEDQQYDASVASDLRKLKKQLLQTTIENI